MYVQYALAEKLGKTLKELQEISVQEYQGWIAYLELVEEKGNMAKKNVKFELTAVDKTKAAFDKVTKGLKGVGGAAATASKGVAGIGLAAAGAAAAIAVLVTKSFDAVDAIGKTATQTGIATDTLQAFHLAARESGTSIEGGILL